MKRIISIFVLTFFVKFGLGQVYQSMPQYGYQAPRMAFDSTLQIPTVCGVPTLKSVQLVNRRSAVAYDSCNGRFYTYNPKTQVWSQVSGSTIDTSNKWVNSVTKTNDSTIQVIKGTTTTDISFTTATNTTRLITKVWNKTGSTIARGAVVYINGAHSSQLPSIALAKANNESTSAYTYGLVVDSIRDNSEGTVIQNGAITNLNLPTTTYTDGQTLYLSPTIAGGYTTTKPTAPNHYVAIGTITRAHPNQGTIQVAIRNGFQLDELSDVKISAVPADSTLLQFSRADSLWHDVSPTTAIGSRYIKPSDTATMLTNYAKTSAVNLKVNISDTSTMLTNYAKSSDVNLKVNISDTANMLTNYAKNAVVNNKLNTSDSSTYFTKFRSDTMRNNLYGSLLRKTDTSTLSTRIDLRMKYTDTSSMLTNYFRKSDTLLSTKFRVNFSATTTEFPVIIKNTNSSATQSNVLSFDCSATGADQPVFVNLASTAAKGMVFFASNQATSSSPAGAGFQIYSTGSTNFPGQMYFDGGAHNSSSIIFRTAQTSGTITQRMRIFAGGNVSISSSATDPGYLLNVNGTMRATQFFLSALNTAPATAASTGTLGEIRIDANYIYICTATNTWKRVAIATW